MTGNASVRTKSLLLIAALAAGTLLAAGGATAQIRSDLSAGVSHLMVAVESARIPQADIGTALDDFAWNGANGESHVVKTRSEEHTSELQSQSNLVCRLLLEKK